MTKAKMIETMQKRFAELWVELKRYENENAPDDGNIGSEIYWEKTDHEYNEKLAEWYGVSKLMEDMGIPVDYSLPEMEEASELSTNLWHRRQANKGIIYDTNGNPVDANDETSDYTVETRKASATGSTWYYIARISTGETMERTTAYHDAVELLKSYRELEKAEKEA